MIRLRIRIVRLQWCLQQLPLLRWRGQLLPTSHALAATGVIMVGAANAHKAQAGAPTRRLATGRYRRMTGVRRVRRLGVIARPVAAEGVAVSLLPRFGGLLRRYLLAQLLCIPVDGKSDSQGG